MTEPAPLWATVPLGVIPDTGGLQLRVTGLHHSQESFVAWFFIDETWPADLDPHSLRPTDPRSIGPVSVYGHGDTYGNAAQLDQALGPFDTALPLGPTVDRLGLRGRDGVLLWIVRDAGDALQPARWLRFDALRIERH